MRTLSRTSITLLAAAALGAAPVQSQSFVSVGIGTGSVFAGVGFGIGGLHTTSSLFVGSTFGEPYGGYGIYSASYNGWGAGYGGARHYAYSRDYCRDYYEYSYWDPYSSWQSDCVGYGQYSYNSSRARRWSSRWGGYYGPSTYVYISDPFSSPWGPYWAYDPWGSSYWDGYRDGRRYGLWDNYYGGRVRTVYASGGRLGTSIYRPSPLSPIGPSYKESPGVAGSRTAARRSGANTPSATPAAAPGRVASVSRGGAQPSSRPAIARTPPSGGAVTRTASPSPRATARPSDRVAGTDRAATARPSGARTSPATSGTPSARVAPSTRSTPSSGARPSDRSRPSPSTRVAPTRQGAPSTRSAPSRQSAPSTRSAPSRQSAPATRSAPSRQSAPSARSAPSSRSSGTAPRSAPARGSSRRPGD